MSLYTLITILAICIILLYFLPRYKVYGIASKTKLGESVKSIGEKRIANWLNTHNIKYIYESPIYTGSWWTLDRRIVCVPDFFLYEYGVYIEYRGMTGIADYDRKTRYKQKYYHNHNIKYISIYPEDLNKLGEVIYAGLT